jgi:hypothetical protein
MMLFSIFAILSTVFGQLGPNYDPLFYDVMIYIFAAIILVISIIVLIVRKVLKNNNN